MKVPAKYNYVRSQVGFSLIELVVTIVVLAIALSAVSTNLFTNVGRSADPLWQTKSALLAQVYLDEALATRYAETSNLGGGTTGVACAIDGAEAGETNRTLFDDVDDYNGLVQTGSFLDTGVATDYSNYSISIAVTCTNQLGATDDRTKLIQVTVTAPGNNTLVVSAFRGDF